jgi:hypothetical protein
VQPGQALGDLEEVGGVERATVGVRANQPLLLLLLDEVPTGGEPAAATDAIVERGEVRKRG